MQVRLELQNQNKIPTSEQSFIETAAETIYIHLLNQFNQ